MDRPIDNEKVACLGINRFRPENKYTILKMAADFMLTGGTAQQIAQSVRSLHDKWDKHYSQEVNSTRWLTNQCRMARYSAREKDKRGRTTRNNYSYGLPLEPGQVDSFDKGLHQLGLLGPAEFIHAVELIKPEDDYIGFDFSPIYVHVSANLNSLQSRYCLPHLLIPNKGGNLDLETRSYCPNIPILSESKSDHTPSAAHQANERLKELHRHIEGASPVPAQMLQLLDGILST